MMSLRKSLGIIFAALIGAWLSGFLGWAFIDGGSGWGHIGISNTVMEWVGAIICGGLAWLCQRRKDE